MKHTYTKFKAGLKNHGRDAFLVAIAATFVGLITVKHESEFGAHFFQRSLQHQKTTVEQAFGVTSRGTVALVDGDDLRAAAPEDASSSSREASSEDSSSESASESSVPAAVSFDEFPALRKAAHPVSKVPDWGAMRTPAEWNRPYSQLGGADFVTVPAYDLRMLTIPLSSLVNPIKPSAIPLLTAKLYYSTRYMAKYDLDADEHSGGHDGVDLKLALGTPVGAVAGGRVYATDEDNILGKYVLIEHRSKAGTRYLSIYGHLQSFDVAKGEDVTPGQTVGRVGMTGNTSGPHLHLAIHQASGEGSWDEYDMDQSINPMDFLKKYEDGE